MIQADALGEGGQTHLGHCAERPWANPASSTQVSLHQNIDTHFVLTSGKI